MADPTLSIKVGVDVDPAKKALREVDTALGKTATNAKAAGSKIDEAFKAASGKVQEAIGPLGKLLGPTAIGIGAVGLALGAMGAAASKAFSVMKDGAETVKRMGSASGLAAGEIKTLTERTKAAETAFGQLSAAAGLFASNFVSRMTPAVGTMAEFLRFLSSSGDPSAGAFDAGAAAQRSVLEERGRLDLERNRKRTQETVTEQRRRQDIAQREADARAARAAAARARMLQQREIMGSLDSGMTWGQIVADENRKQALRDEYAAGIAAYHQQRRESRLETISRIESSRAPAAPAAPPSQTLSMLAGVGAQGGARFISSMFAGQNAGAAGVSALGSVASSAASMFLGPLGPIAGALIGGAADALAGLFGAEDAASKARRDAREAMRKQQLRDTAAARRNAPPGFDPFLGSRGGPAIVNVNFHGPVGSPGRIARSVADSLGGR